MYMYTQIIQTKHEALQVMLHATCYKTHNWGVGRAAAHPSRRRCTSLSVQSPPHGMLPQQTSLEGRGRPDDVEGEREAQVIVYTVLIHTCTEDIPSHQKWVGQSCITCSFKQREASQMTWASQ